MYTGPKSVAISGLLLVAVLSTGVVYAERPTVEIEIRNHLFWPAEFTVPANTRIKLLISNNDPTPEEFESYSLNREKVIMGNRSAVVFIGPLSAGQYPFFGEFHPKTAQGMVIAE